jgi:hypothetical protein
MAGEQRRDRGDCYRAQQIDGRVVKKYVGTGAIADQSAEEDGQVRLERRLERQRIAQVEADLLELGRLADLVGRESARSYAELLRSAGWVPSDTLQR